MVVQGGFSLQLIDAGTQQPLNEYRGPSGSVYYAEAKPGGEYFLRFQVLQDDTKKAGDKAADKGKHDTMMYFRPAVDGKDLGFYTNLTKSQGARDVGLWTYVKGVGTNQALKFETAAVASTDDKPTTPSLVKGTEAATVSEEESQATSAPGTKSPPLLYMGNVQVRISKAIFTGYQKRVCTSVPDLTREETVMAEAAASISASSSLQEEEEEEANGTASLGTTVDPASNKAEGPLMDPVPVLRSREGAAKFQQEFTKECPTYQPGELLETITIHYGSIAALIQAGILVPISGAVPEYVGVAPTAPSKPKLKPTLAVVTPAPSAATNTAAPAKVIVPNPLLDISSSGTKRLHGATTEGSTKGAAGEIMPPATKKPCHPVAAEPAVVVASAVVSTK